MSEKQPSHENEVTPEQQIRKDRYYANLENLQNSNVEEFYPPETKRREWVEITDTNEIKQYWENLGSIKKQLSPEEHGLYRDQDNEHTFLAPRFRKYSKPREVLLDMLATTKDIAPWAPSKGIMRPQDPMFTDTAAFWTPRGTTIEIKPAVLESLVNGLGDSKYTLKEKQGFLNQDIAALLHENVHIHNKQEGVSWTDQTLFEIAPMTAEYLAFPGRNKKMNEITENAREVLRGEQKKEDYYNNATLLGMLIMAKHEQLLPENENISEIEKGLDAWQEDVESLPSEELAAYRQKVTDSWMLSENDEKLKVELTELRQQYPELTSRLLGQQT